MEEDEENNINKDRDEKFFVLKHTYASATNEMGSYGG
jgi:hypothetical protein